MKSNAFRLLALLLAVLMMVSLFTACEQRTHSARKDPGDKQPTEETRPTEETQPVEEEFIPTDFEDMVYVRPDLEAIAAAHEKCMETVLQDDFAIFEADLDAYSELYNDFCTNYFLANIYYSKDLTDEYWTEEYNFCMGATADVEADVEDLMYAIADSVHRETLEKDEDYGEGYFDDYDGENYWDDTFTALNAREADLIAQYYDLTAQGNEMGYAEYYGELAPKMCQLYVDLVQVRQEIAAYAGYDSYPEYAYEKTYHRDYTPTQEAAYLKQVQEHLAPIYYDMYTEGIYVRLRSRDEEDTYAYVEELAGAMGGRVQEAFEFMTTYHLYDITQSDNKFNSSFEVYLITYEEPYVFVNPTGTEQDYLTFSHEFGHFCNDYISEVGITTVDVAEVFSQGMEYLSLFYVDGPERLQTQQMVSSLCVYVEQSAFADFEQRIYAMDPDELTVDVVFDLFEEVGCDYGFDAWGVDGRQFVSIPHFFTSPCYVFSYVVSNDAAMQLYQMEAEESGTGLALFMEQLATEEEDFLAFVEAAGLGSPFADGRIESVAETFREILFEE